MPQLLCGERNVQSYSSLQQGGACRGIDANDWALREMVVEIGDRSRAGKLFSGICLFLRNEILRRDLLAHPKTPLDGSGTGQNRMAQVYGGDDVHSGG
jgi:hypothetical protein